MGSRDMALRSDGSPVHAGIDLLTKLAFWYSMWFPRTRGDRPTYLSGPLAVDEVPPYTRG